MSKQNTKKQKAQKSAEKAEEARLRALRIGLIALLAAVVLIGGGFGIRALVKRHNAPKDPAVTDTTSAGEPKNLDNADYSFVDYRGMQMPAVFADMMREGDALRASLCEDGVAMKIGTREISKTEFEMYYYDQYRSAKNDAENSTSSYGENRSGFDPEKTPDKQYYRGSTTWEAHFIESATEKLRHDAGCYEMALQAGTIMDEYGITYLQQRIEVSRSQAEAKNISEDDLFRESYGGCNVTATLYYTRLIMNAMISAYQTQWSETYADGISQEALEAAFNKDPRSYQTIDARIYLIESQEGLDAASQVHTEQDLIAFAKKYHPSQETDMEIFTDQRCSRYSTVSSVFGEVVANWLFDESREIGVCGLIEDDMFYYLAVPLSKPYLSTSVEAELHPVDYLYESADSDAKAKEEAESFRDQVLADGGTAEAFEAAAAKVGDNEAHATVSILDFDEYGPAVYLFDQARKPGDMTILKLQNYYLVAMFVKKNAEDYDWINEVKTDLVNDAWEQAEAEYLKENAGELNQRVADKAVAAVNDRLAAALKAA